MKYQGMPAGMWLLFGGSFRKNLVEVLGFGRKEAGMITSAAKRKYREIIDGLPEFEKGDRFKMNIYLASVLISGILMVKNWRYFNIE